MPGFSEELRSPAVPPPVPDPQFTQRARKVRLLLLISFGWLLVLLIGAGLDAFVSARRLDGVSQEVSQRFSARNQAVVTIVLSVHDYDDHLERFLLQDQLSDTAPDLSAISRDIDAIRSALLRFPAENDPDERALLDAIQQQLQDEEDLFASITSWRPELRQQRAYPFITGQLIPWRTRVYELSEEISRLNARKLALDNLAIAVKFQLLENRLMWMVGTALLAGVLMSAICGWYILRLERQGRQRYQALAQNRLDLEGLSARLVAVQEEERRSISRELHDEVGQSLGALLVEIGQLGKLVPGEDRVAQSQLTHIKSVAENAVKSIRDMALLLRPPMLDDLGLIPALEWQAREISRRSDMEVEVHSEHVSEDLSDELKVCVYRLVQEALNNAASHSSAKNAKVSVAQRSGTIHIEITDNGSGFDPGRSRGMGILGVEERVRHLGGTLSIDSAPGKGATIKADIPLQSAASPVESSS